MLDLTLLVFNFLCVALFFLLFGRFWINTRKPLKAIREEAERLRKFADYSKQVEAEDDFPPLTTGYTFLDIKGRKG